MCSECIARCCLSPKHSSCCRPPPHDAGAGGSFAAITRGLLRPGCGRRAWPDSPVVAGHASDASGTTTFAQHERHQPCCATKFAQQRTLSGLPAKKFAQRGASSGSSAKKLAHQRTLSGLPAKKFAQHAPSSGVFAKKFAQHAIKRRFWAIFRALGELFRARVRAGPSRANFFAHRTQPRADFETNDTSAPADTGKRETAVTTARP